MPSLISASELVTISTTFDDIFDTRARTLIVYKTPIKIPAPYTESNMVFGFGESQKEDAFTYQQVTGVFPAVICNNKGVTILDNAEIMSRISSLEARIKVRKDCRDYINNGPTDKFVFDERTFYSQGEEININGQFWLFDLITTK